MTWQEILFVGPYAEWNADVVAKVAQNPDMERLFDHAGLHWNISPSGWPRVFRGVVRLEVACCAPAEQRAECPRWPMTLEWQGGSLQGSSMEVVTDWTDLDRHREIDWFLSVFNQELAELTELTEFAPLVRWGLLTWVIG